MTYSYTDARNKTTGIRLVRRPRHKASLSIDYAASSQLNLWASLQYVGDRLDINPVFNPAMPNIDPGDYILIDAGASYAIDDRITLFGKIRNLADKRYQPVAGYRGEGINGIVGLRMSL